MVAGGAEGSTLDKGSADGAFGTGLATCTFTTPAATEGANCAIPTRIQEGISARQTRRGRTLTLYSQSPLRTRRRLWRAATSGVIFLTLTRRRVIVRLAFAARPLAEREA